MALVYISCPSCRTILKRTVKQVNVVAKNSGHWSCRSCANAKNNTARARPIGATRTSSKGYVVEKTNEGWRLQHRVTMERELGRKLSSSELVHHKNEAKTENEPANLELSDWSTHTRTHHTGAKRSALAKENIRLGITKRAGTKMSTEKAEQARALVFGGATQASVAKLFNASPMTISRAVRGESWKNGIAE